MGTISPSSLYRNRKVVIFLTKLNGASISRRLVRKAFDALNRLNRFAESNALPHNNLPFRWCSVLRNMLHCQFLISPIT
jgi:hypothetical protein